LNSFWTFYNFYIKYYQPHNLSPFQVLENSLIYMDSEPLSYVSTAQSVHMWRFGAWRLRSQPPLELSLMQGQQDKKLKLLGALESKTCSHKRHGILCIFHRRFIGTIEVKQSQLMICSGKLCRLRLTMTFVSGGMRNGATLMAPSTELQVSLLVILCLMYIIAWSSIFPCSCHEMIDLFANRSISNTSQCEGETQANQ
jgi:hypothetical protein